MPQVPAKADQLKSYGQQVVQALAPPEETGWGQRTELHVQHWPTPVVLQHRDGVKFLQDLLKRPGVQQALHLEGQPHLASDGTRRWSKPWEADAFLAEQHAVRCKHGPHAKVLALQVGVIAANTTATVAALCRSRQLV